MAEAAVETRNVSSQHCVPDSCCEPLMPVIPGEPMTTYFQRFHAAFAASPPMALTKVDRMTADGIYIHKRPIRSPSGQSPLAVCGSVYHHVIVYIKEGDKMHLLDFGPGNGTDVTANIMEASPSRAVVQSNLSMEDVHALQQVDGAPMPYLYCGPVLESLDSSTVQQAIKFIESGHYHALWRNCIHAADLLLRCLTRGQLRSGPMLYDLVAGEVPTVENPLVMMLQMMMKRSWMDVCDGSALTRQAAGLLGWPVKQPEGQDAALQSADEGAADGGSAAAAVAALARAAMSAAAVSAAQVPPSDGEGITAQSS